MTSLQGIVRLAILSAVISCALFVLSLVLRPDIAHASWCSAHEDGLQDAPIVFSGRVLKITRDKRDDIVVLRVSHVWRGVTSSQPVIHTGETSRDCGAGNCGYKFKTGSDYLVFAYEWPAQPGVDFGGSLTIPPGVPTFLMTDICSRTSLLSAARQDIISLGPGRLPSAGSGGLEQNQVLLFHLMTGFAVMVIGAGLRRFSTRRS